jgi:hypothetical protein
MFPAIQTRDENSGWFIRRSCLHLIIGTLFRSAFFTGIHVGRGFDIGIEFGGIAFDFLLNECRPPIGIHFLMGHKGELLRGEFTRLERGQDVFVEIAMDGAKPVAIELGEEGIDPFFDDFLFTGFLDGVVENGFF